MTSLFKKPQIPVRSSSKEVFEAFSEVDQKKFQDVDEEIRKITKKSKQNPLKSRMSYDAKFFSHVSRYSELLSIKAGLSCKRSLTKFMQNSEDATEETWEQTREARRLNEQEQTFKLDAQMFKVQAKRRKIANVDEIQLRHFMQEWTMSPRGFNAAGFGAGTRDPGEQNRFRQALVEACGAKHPDPRRLELWCPVLGDWVTAKSVHAAHIFLYSLGQVAMHNIFGLQEYDELSAVDNGLMLCDEVEDRISEGLIAIIPDVPDRPSQPEVDKWRKSEPKEYKIRVLDYNAEKMKTYYPRTANTQVNKIWIEIDGRHLLFSSDQRPRARYLYWQYCTSILRRSWKLQQEEQRDMLKSEFDRG